MLTIDDLDAGAAVDRRIDVTRWPFAVLRWHQYGHLRQLQLTADIGPMRVTAIGTAPGGELLEAVAYLYQVGRQNGAPWL